MNEKGRSGSGGGLFLRFFLGRSDEFDLLLVQMGLEAGVLFLKVDHVRHGGGHRDALGDGFVADEDALVALDVDGGVLLAGEVVHDDGAGDADAGADLELHARGGARGEGGAGRGGSEGQWGRREEGGEGHGDGVTRGGVGR